MAAKVVAVGRGAEHRRFVEARRGRDAGEAHVLLLPRHGVPDLEQVPGAAVLEENAAMATVEHGAVRQVGVRKAERRGGDEAGEAEPVMEESQKGRCSTEFAVAAEEGAAGEEVVPEFADEGGVEEVLRLVRRESDEYLDDEVVQ